MATHESQSEQRFPTPARDEDVAMVVIESAPYQEFDQWMDRALERLVARWIHAAAPNAFRQGLLKNRISHK